MRRNQAPPVSRIVSGLFRTIAIDESDIERLRQELAQNREFDARTLFERINTNKDSHITAEELLKFMNDHYVKKPTLEKCQALIAEFDSSQDGTLQYDEFLNVIMPAANQSLRDYCLYGRRVPSYYTEQSRPLPVSVSSMISRILERELNLQDKRTEARLDLFKHVDHSKYKTFHEMSRGQVTVNMATLIIYLEDNGFHPRTEDLEAILRRCDHDADRCISFEEFCELTELPEGGTPDDESMIHDTKTNMENPDRLELKETVEQSPIKRSNSNARLDGETKENIEESWERKEYERQ